jgi:hypothetical protein
MPRALATIDGDFAKLLLELRRVGDDRERRTVTNRRLAELAFEMREHFLTEEGNPDLAGRTWKYRDHVRNLYRDAAFSEEEAKTAQSAVRYHLGNIARQRLDPEQLEDAGLSDTAPVVRGREAREGRSVLLRSIRAGEGPDPDIVKAITGALVLLQRADAKRVAALRGKELQLTRDALEALETRVAELRRATASEG